MRIPTQVSNTASSPFSALIASAAPESLQPCSSTLVSNTSRVPCLVPGTNTWISWSGSDGSMSDQLVAVFAVSLPSTTTLAASALYHCSGVNAKLGPLMSEAKTMPS